MKSILGMSVTTLAFALALVGCGDDKKDPHDHDHDGSVHADGGDDGGNDASVTPDASGPKAVTIQFAGVVGDEAFGCGETFTGLGTSNSTVSPNDFRLYVHNVRLVTADDEEVEVTLDQDGAWQYENVALLDFEDGTGDCENGTSETNTVVKGTVPAGDYVGVKFVAGLPFELNHGDAATAPSPLNLTALFWGWNYGYTFIRIEGQTIVDSETVYPFFAHIGSTDCVGDAMVEGVQSCGRPNRPDVSFDTFDVDSDVISVDYAAVFAGNDLTTDLGGAPGCMSGLDDPECESVFAALGIDFTTGAPAAGQTVFTVE